MVIKLIDFSVNSVESGSIGELGQTRDFATGGEFQERIF